MILVCGIPSEPPLQLVTDAAERLGVSYVLFNQREALHNDMHLEIRDGRIAGTLRIHEADWPLHEFSGAYTRLMDHKNLPELQPRGRTPTESESIYKSNLLHSALSEWLEIANCRVMNRNRAMSSNMSKPFQAQFAIRAGFRTPTTLVTNEAKEVRNFLRVHRRVVYKSVSSVRSIVQMLNDVKLNDLRKVRNLPTQFQAFVPGVNVRVHVVGDSIFATEIHSEAIDYRYATDDGADVAMIPVELPPEIAARCFNLSRELSLPLCGIDLKRTPEGDYYCFEANPSPAYSYYQENSGQDIATAIVRYLQE